MPQFFHGHKKSTEQESSQKPLFDQVDSFDDYLRLSDASSFIEQCFSFPLDKKKLLRKAYDINEVTFRYCNSVNCSAEKMCRFFEKIFSANLDKFLKDLVVADDKISDESLEKNADILMGVLLNWNTMESLCTYAFQFYDKMCVLEFNARIVSTYPYFPDFISGKEEGCVTSVSNLLKKMFNDKIFNLLPSWITPLCDVILRSYGKWRDNAKMQKNIDFFFNLLVKDNTDRSGVDAFVSKYIDNVFTACHESLIALSSKCIDTESGVRLVQDCMKWMNYEIELAQRRITAPGASALKIRINELIKVSVTPILCSVSLSLLRSGKDIEVRNIYSIIQTVQDSESLEFFRNIFSKYVLGECYSFIEDCLCDHSLDDYGLFILRFSKKEKDLLTISANISGSETLKPLVCFVFKSIIYDKKFCLSHLPPEFNPDKIDKDQAKSAFTF